MLASAGGFVWAIRGRREAGFARWLLLVSGVCVLAGVVARWRAGGHAPLANQYESIVFAALAASVAAFLGGVRRSWAAAIAGLAVALLLALATLFHAPVAPLVPALRSNWLVIHVASCMGAYAAFLLSAFASGWILLRNRVPRTPAAANLLLADRRLSPPVQDLDAYSIRLVRAGFALLAVGIATGAVWADRAWGVWWSWDPKETWSLITWIFYALALHLRRTRGWRGDRFARLSLAGLAIVVFTWFGVNFLLPGLHSYGRG
jgi:cytochrome c-type biogenesis protein CcsB